MPPHDHDLSNLRRWRAAAVALAACAATSALVAAYAWTAPATQAATSQVPYTQRAEFSYAAAGATSVYERGQVHTGDPVFLRTARTVDITASYDFAADSSHEVRGTIGLSAEIEDGSGWHRSFQLAAPAPFDGSRAVRTAPLDLAALQESLADMRAATGATSGSYLVDVVADITVAGAVGDRSVDATFEPRLELQMDAVRLAPRSLGDPRATTFTTSDTSHLDASHRIENHVGLGWVTVPIGALRVVSGAVALATAFAAGIAIVGLRRCLPDETAKTALRHGHHIVPVRATERGSGVRVLDVTSIGDLVRLAAQHDVLILHEGAPDSDTYHFQVDGTVYRYVSGNGSRSTPRHTTLTRS
jgi:hypothetical protein